MLTLTRPIAFGKSFIYGHAGSSTSAQQYTHGIKLEPRSQSVPTVPTIEQCDCVTAPLPEGVAITSAWIPWLSQHHRMLFHHFIGTTLSIFAEGNAVQQEIRSAIIPMAVDTNHGFSLLAAILSLASTHRMNLGLHKDEAEIEYWRDMSVGHLRRPMLQEDESTENVFAATALILCIRDVISDGEKPFSWKLHLQGAFTVLARSGTNLTAASRGIRRPLKKLAQSLQLRSLLPMSLALPPTAGLGREPNTENEVYGFPDELAGILQDIRALRLEKSALQNIEANSTSSNMQPLWGALRGQCLEIVVRLRTFSDHPPSTTNDGTTETYRLYGYVALLQTYSAVLDLPMTDSGLRTTFEASIATLRKSGWSTNAYLSPHLVCPLFTIGSLAQTAEDRSLVATALQRIGREHGKGNATLANTFLEELWSKSDSRSQAVTQLIIDALMSKSARFFKALDLVLELTKHSR